MKAVLEVTDATGTRRVVTRPRDLVAWERATGRSLSTVAAEGLSFTDLCTLAWQADTAGRVDLDAWLDDLVDVTMVGVEDPDPTRPGPGPAPSSR